MQLWPANDTALGPSFDTTGGDVLFDRAEAWYTDEMFLAPRRLLIDKASSLQPTFAYYFAELIPGNDPSLGGNYRYLKVSSYPSLFSSVPCVRATALVRSHSPGRD